MLSALDKAIHVYLKAVAGSIFFLYGTTSLPKESIKAI